MNQFEKDVQCKRNDFNDAVVAFVASFVFFTLIFLVATIVDVAGSFS
ncbi:YqzM-like protein [Alteribacillus iranensis]|uniref:YqzM-like protein n=1 Tax=Alteribacillus iranensis TaxID=930128 RepID=A0A1I1Z9S2_9BACI|nr:YqzM family protein [Alteribacillus iranensis]SFE28516.1 YqzM-like protein [Alteribacillus iranensis]